MSWNEIEGAPKPPGNRKSVALAGAGFVLLFIVIFALIVHFAGGSKGNGAATSSTTTSTTDQNGNVVTTTSTPGGGSATTDPGTLPKHSVSTLAPYDSTPSTLPPDFERNPEGTMYTPEMLALNFPRSDSNLTTSQYNKATLVASTFATADATGAGADQFGYYYNATTGPTNLPWLKDMSIQWAFATETTVGTIQASIWYKGVITGNNQVAQQVRQEVFLDKETMNVVYPWELKSRGVTPPISCCISIVKD